MQMFMKKICLNCSDIVARYIICKIPQLDSQCPPLVISCALTNKKVENLKDLVKRMSISGDLNAKALGARKASDHFGTDDESANLDRNCSSG